MIESGNINERRPVWLALSDFYLDTELQESDFLRIARTIIDSPYTLEQVREIDKYEIFPLLQINLLHPAGEWAGFEEKWLVKSITDSLENRTESEILAIDVKYNIYKWMCEDYWMRLKQAYNEIKKSKTYGPD